jgi:DNA-binding beta-propeller fold protein YncE
MEGFRWWRVRTLGLLLALVIIPVTLCAQEHLAPIKSVAQITIDDDGRELYYPSAVFFDPVEEEIYLVNGGSSRVVVYGPDFFPRVSIGTGRGIAAPRGVHVTSLGQVYIPQGRNKKNPVQRITVLNGAFFLEREINLDDIPEAATIRPRQVVVNREGLIYLVGESIRGVLVLDKEGTFLRRLQPMDAITDREAIAATRLEAEQQREEQELQREAARVLDGTDDGEDGDSQRPAIEIPEEFRPRSRRQDEEAGTGRGLGPVRVRYLHIDSTGRLYLVSAETSKIYVYSPEETFLFAFGEKGGTPRKLSQPSALAIDEKRGLIYVVDYMRHTILTFDLNGKFLFEVGGRGTGPGWFNFPSDIAINRQGHLIISDLFNRRVQVLDVQYEGTFSAFRGTPAEPVPEEGGPAAPPADDAEVPEGDGEAVAPQESEGEPAADAEVEEVILPEQPLPVPVEGDAGGSLTPAAAPPSPADDSAEQSVPALEPAAPAAPAEPEAQPAAASGEEVAPELPAEPADAEVEEQVIPAQELPVYPAEKQD